MCSCCILLEDAGADRTTATRSSSRPHSGVAGDVVRCVPPVLPSSRKYRGSRSERAGGPVPFSLESAVPPITRPKSRNKRLFFHERERTSTGSLARVKTQESRGWTGWLADQRNRAGESPKCAPDPSIAVLLAPATDAYVITPRRTRAALPSCTQRCRPRGVHCDPSGT